MIYRLNARGHPTFDRRWASALGHVPQGDTLPTVHTQGDLFLLVTPAASPVRRWLFQSDGTTWQPIIAYGTTTLYVDGTNGSDTQNKGTATTTGAYATIQYAINQVPALLFGSVTINIAAGTYREQVTIRGKTFAGNYTITLTGAITVQSGFPDTATAGANPAANGSAGYGTITDGTAAYTVNAYRNMWVEITSGTGSGQIRVVHSNTATVITTVGRWDTVPDATSVFRVFDVPRITGSDSGADTTAVRGTAITLDNQRGVVLAYLKLNYTTNANLLVSGASALPSITYCAFNNGSTYGLQVEQYSLIPTIQACVFNENATSLLATDSATITTLLQCRIASTVAGGIGVYGLSGSTLALMRQNYISHTGAGCIQALFSKLSRGTADDYNEFRGTAGTGDNITVDSNSMLAFNGDYSARTTQVTRDAGGWGALAASGGINFDVSGITFTTNTSGTYTPTTLPAGGGS